MEEESFEDWRDSEYLTPVKSQGYGECCFACAGCAAVEVLHHKHTKKTTGAVQKVILSPQDLWNNLESVHKEKDDEGGCSILKTLSWINENGCVLEADCPYKGVLEPPIPLAERQVKMRIETITPVPLENMESYVKYKGPVMVEIDWTKELENINGNMIYSGPVNEASFGRATTHAVLVIGFGTQTSEDGGEPIHYWIIQNSHSDKWGHNGFARVNRALIHNRYLIQGGLAPEGIAYERPGVNGAPYEKL